MNTRIWHVWVHAEWAGPLANTEVWAEHMATALGKSGLEIRTARQVSNRLVVDGFLTAAALTEAAGAVLGGIASTGLATVLVGLEIGDRSEREGHVTMPELQGVAEVARALNISKSRASRLARSTGFPVPVATLSSGPIWVKAHVEGWSKTWGRRSGKRIKRT
jgi:hypothetical protein